MLSWVNSIVTLKAECVDLPNGRVVDIRVTFEVDEDRAYGVQAETMETDEDGNEVKPWGPDNEPRVAELAEDIARKWMYNMQQDRD
jgi:hypothetical protein